MLQRELRDPRLAWVSVTRVEVAPDLREARVLYSCMPETEADRHREEVQENLERASGYLRKLLGSRLTLRTVPRLEFVHDDSLEHGDHISRLLRSLDPGDGDGQ